MPDHIWVSDYSEAMTDPDIGYELTDQRFAQYHALAWWRPDDLMQAARTISLDGYVTIAVLYAGIRYAEGDNIKGLWWAGWSGPVDILQRMIDASAPTGLITFPKRQKAALDLAKRMVPGIIPKEPSNLIAWSLRVPG